MIPKKSAIMAISLALSFLAVYGLVFLYMFFYDVVVTRDDYRIVADGIVVEEVRKPGCHEVARYLFYPFLAENGYLHWDRWQPDDHIIADQRAFVRHRYDVDVFELRCQRYHPRIVWIYHDDKQVDSVCFDYARDSFFFSLSQRRYKMLLHDLGMVYDPGQDADHRPQ